MQEWPRLALIRSSRSTGRRANIESQWLMVKMSVMPATWSLGPRRNDSCSTSSWLGLENLEKETSTLISPRIQLANSTGVNRIFLSER